MTDRWLVADRRDRAALEDVLRSQPLVARRMARGATAELPLLATRGVDLGLLFGSLDLVAVQLCYLAKLRGGATLEAARVEAPELPVAELQLAAQRLQLAGLAAVVDDRLTLHPHLDDSLALSQPTVAGSAALLTNDVLDRALRLLGLPVPARKADRLAALAATLGDRDRLLAALEGVSAEALQLFERVVQATIEGRTHGYGTDGSVSLYELDLEDLPGLQAGSFGRGRRAPVDELCDRQLLGSDSAWTRYEVWVWAETLVALRGRLFERWVPAAAPEPVPLGEGPPAAATVLGALRDLITHVAANPPLGKRTGESEPPVKYWRAAAKALRIEVAQAALLGDLARRLGLLVPVLGPVQGRGRNATQDVRWHPEPQRVAGFEALPVAQRWALVVHCWSEAGRPELTQPRLLVLDLLCELPDGCGAPAAALSAWAADRHRALHESSVVDEVIGDLLHLGVASSSSGAVGLAPAGRAVLFDLEALASLLGAGGTTFVCQPDHSIIAPADLRASITEQLRRIATLQSHGGATVWRLDAAAIAREAQGRDAAELVAFLREHSSVPVPPAVERFVLDSARAVEPVTVQAVGCVITGADPATVADAARVKAAKLTVLAPGVATSPLPADKVTELLLARGVVLSRAPSPVAKARAAGPAPAASLLEPIEANAVAPTWLVEHVPVGEPLPQPKPVGAGIGPLQTNALAERLLGEGKRRRRGEEPS
ncbi:MAG: helicase-associated domain-containing protein [Acidimicrobiia bacterium]